MRVTVRRDLESRTGVVAVRKVKVWGLDSRLGDFKIGIELGVDLEARRVPCTPALFTLCSGLGDWGPGLGDWG